MSLKLHLATNSRPPNYEVRAYITIHKIGTVTEADHEDLKNLRTKLEQTIPSNLKTRYNLGLDQLMVTVKIKTATEARRMADKLTDYIRGSATSLKLRL